MRALSDPGDGAQLDQALVLWLPAPESFTGEDQAELHIHGGIAVRAAVLRALSGMPGLRGAEPGEFTRRAFLAGRMDLSAVEGLADLIDAETEAQRRQALRQLEGALAKQVETWRDRLIEASALIEAGLDFSDEEDVHRGTAAQAVAIATSLRAEIAGELTRAASGERLREGYAVVIAGPPNAGKSTLLNTIARRDVAIVSPHAGTTRDALEVRCDLGGLPVTFIDTAGLRVTEDAVEQHGIARARERAAAADLVLWLTSPDAASDEVPDFGPQLVHVRTKSDIGSGSDAAEGVLPVSAVTGYGLERLLDTVRNAAERELVGEGGALATRERHRTALVGVVDALTRAEAAAASGQDEFAAEDIRLALRALGRITGRVDVEDVLDRVFAQFCIGK